MMYLLIIAFPSANIFSQNIPSGSDGKKLMAVFAHADDELLVAPVLAKYAAEGVKVHLIVVTDGRWGTTDHAGIPGGDSLATIRKQELFCSAAALGLQPPVILGIQDQLHFKDGWNAFTGALDSMRRAVYKLFLELKPDVLITFGPSGWTGHPDHRLVGITVTEIFAYQKWDWPVRLYYPELPTGSISDDSRTRYFTVDSSHLTIRVPVTERDFKKAKSAWQCHKSQYTTAAQERLSKFIWDTQKGIAMFRQFLPNPSKKSSLFDTIPDSFSP